MKDPHEIFFHRIVRSGFFDHLIIGQMATATLGKSQMVLPQSAKDIPISGTWKTLRASAALLPPVGLGMIGCWRLRQVGPHSHPLEYTQTLHLLHLRQTSDVCCCHSCFLQSPQERSDGPLASHLPAAPWSEGSEQALRSPAETSWASTMPSEKREKLLYNKHGLSREK